MQLEFMIPIVLFVCIAYVLKHLIDARGRAQLLRAGASEDSIRSLLQSEELSRRHASLRWGISLVALSLAFGMIELFKWHDVTPGVVALLLLAVGGGNLIFFTLSRRLG